MPIRSESYTFSKANVDTAPDQSGVYELSKQGSVIYIGMSQKSIRGRLQDHLAGREGACTKAAISYKREVTSAAQAPVREAVLLAEYKRAHGGKLPLCNVRAS